MGVIERKEYASSICTPVRFCVGDIPMLRQKYRPGQTLILKRRELVRIGTMKPYVKIYREQVTVAGVYPYHVGVVNKYGVRESLNYFELEEMTAE